VSIERVTFRHGDREVSLTGKQMDQRGEVSVISGELMDDTKEELAEALAAVSKASRELKACAMCQLSGIGRYDHSAFQDRRHNWVKAVQAVEALFEDTVPDVGLLEAR